MTVCNPEPGRDHVLVLGPSKTGTTGMYAAIKYALRSVAPDAQTLFEPADPQLVDHVFELAPTVPLLVKATLDTFSRVVPDPLVFDRRIMTVRDPRDMLISALLFRPLTRRAVLRTDEAVLERFVEALEQKEAHPSSISVRELFELAEELGIGAVPFPRMVRHLRGQLRLLAIHPFHLVRYEDFVAGRLADLSDYLGLRVHPPAVSASATFGHISRSRSSGEFVRWFRPDDVAFFNTLFEPAITAFDYEREVVGDHSMAIDPSTASKYVRSRFYARRAGLDDVAARHSRTWEPADIDSPEAYDRLADLADNGDVRACLHAAAVALSGHLGGRDPRTALKWARVAAQRGDVSAMELTIDLLAELDADDPACHRELRAWRNAHLARAATASAEKASERVARLEAELHAFHRSGSVRAGTRLAAVGRDPRRAGPRAARALARRWREFVRRRRRSPRRR